ncbi:MAG: enoyl-CoA hydratase-related protein [Thermomicrobiales bacterium]
MPIDLERTGAVAKITINNPERLNALNSALLNELYTTIRTVATDDAIRAIIVTGAGDRSFIAGADISEMATLREHEAQAFARLGHAVASAFEQAPQPVIAAVNGFALGGGCELALAADFRLASENAVFAQPEVGLGIPPGWGGTQRLVRAVGEGFAAEMIYTGRRVKAEEALRVGLVNRVVPQGEVLEAARLVAVAIADNAGSAIRLSKRLIQRSREAAPVAALAEEAHAFASVFGGHDQREGMSAFLAKREAAFDHE